MSSQGNSARIKLVPTNQFPRCHSFLCLKVEIPKCWPKRKGGKFLGIMFIVAKPE